MPSEITLNYVIVILEIDFMRNNTEVKYVDNFDSLHSSWMKFMKETVLCRSSRLFEIFVANLAHISESV